MGTVARVLLLVKKSWYESLSTHVQIPFWEEAQCSPHGDSKNYLKEFQGRGNEAVYVQVPVDTQCFISVYFPPFSWSYNQVLTRMKYVWYPCVEC